MDFVFVYGTLKRGYPYHERGMKHARLVGRCPTREAYPLVVGGRWFSPILLAEPGVGRRDIGEVYEMAPAELERNSRLLAIATEISVFLIVSSLSCSWRIRWRELSLPD